MRNWTLILSVIIVVSGIHSANAGLIATPRETSNAAPAAEANSLDETNQQIKDQLSLTKRERREVQIKLARLGFHTKVDGTFDSTTRGAITRWQEKRGYPTTGFLDSEQCRSLQSEAVVSRNADSEPTIHSHGGRHARQSGGVRGPIGVIGGAVVGLFHRL